MSPLSTPSQQGYHVQTIKPFTFILRLPNSSVRCNCASHQSELGLLNCPPQAFILLQYRDYHVPTVPPNIHSITAIANMYNLFLKHSSLSHAFVCQDFQLTECFLNTNQNQSRTNGPINNHLTIAQVMPRYNHNNEPEDHWSCKRSPDILTLVKHKTYKTWKIYGKEMTLTFNTHITS